MKSYKEGLRRKLKKGLIIHNNLKQLKEMHVHEEMKKKTNSFSLSILLSSLGLGDIFTCEQEGPIAYSHSTLDQQVRKP